MNLLMDTCALICLASGTLSKTASIALAEGNQAFISPVVVWEIAIKVKVGKLQLPERPLVWVEAIAHRHTLTLERRMPDVSILCAAADLPFIHRDPFDRVLVATALGRGLTILTTDSIIPKYPGVKTLS